MTEPATWVYDNRQGVCDELTGLFISMLRELGIPARFVSGVSYTNLPEFAKPWGGHGWAEVWFPDVGWVPFDVTRDRGTPPKRDTIRRTIAISNSYGSFTYSPSPTSTGN